MENSILFDILGSFTKTEMKEFDDLVCSGYFNRKSAVVKLWKVVSKGSDKLISEETGREIIYKKIFPGKKFNYGTLKNLIYDLTRLAEKFIELKTYGRRTAVRELNLCEGLLERGLGKVFERVMARTEITLEKNKDVTGYHSNKYLAEVLKQNYMIQQDRHYQTAGSIKTVNDNLTMGYFIDIIDNNYNWIFMQGEINVPAKNDFLVRFLEYYRNTPVEKDIITKIYYLAFMLVYEEDASYFYELKELLENNLGSLSGEQKYNFFVALANFCQKKIESGITDFAQHEYGIYRFMIDNSIYSIDKVKNMDGAFYKNVAGSAVSAGEIKWAKTFIDTYKTMLEPEVMDNYYCHAMIEFTMKQKKFNETLKYLSKIKHTNFVDKLNIRRWELITAYELEHFEEIRYLIDSSKHFIQNDTKISDLKKLRFSGFLNIVNRLLSFRELKKGKNDVIYSAGLLKQEVEKTDTPHKDWMLEKINELN
ncbi:MAG TPA: hypothetical protein PKE39_00860 [Ignavibacteria bacterium]|nr:hypothetical protein [Ignavibacteria bacterium]HMQ97545.1 hypothetical protein [Ignavibacteria bacterium]